MIDNEFYSEKLVRKGASFCKNNKYDIFYFGHQPDVLYTNTELINNNIIRCRSTLTHAYAISRRFMKFMLDKKYENKPIDLYYTENADSYALYPMIFYQDETKSDIETSGPFVG